MTTQSLPVSTFVDIRTSIEGGGAVRLPFGRGLLVTTDDALSAGGSGKARLFNNINQVAAVFSTGPALTAATTWFSADPQPQGLWIGRWATVDVATSLTGATLTVAANTAPLDASNGSFTVNGQDVTANLAAATTYGAVATAIQAAIVNAWRHFRGRDFRPQRHAKRFCAELDWQRCNQPADLRHRHQRHRYIRSVGHVGKQQPQCTGKGMTKNRL